MGALERPARVCEPAREQDAETEREGCERDRREQSSPARALFGFHKPGRRRQGDRIALHALPSPARRPHTSAGRIRPSFDRRGLALRRRHGSFLGFCAPFNRVPFSCWVSGWLLASVPPDAGFQRSSAEPDGTPASPFISSFIAVSRVAGRLSCFTSTEYRFPIVDRPALQPVPVGAVGCERLDVVPAAAGEESSQEFSPVESRFGPEYPRRRGRRRQCGVAGIERSVFASRLDHCQFARRVRRRTTTAVAIPSSQPKMAAARMIQESDARVEPTTQSSFAVCVFF